jgi:hypothetical protein
MTVWRPHQMLRLAQERKLLAWHMPDFGFREPLGNTHILGTWESNQGNHYTLRIQIPSGYPDECPKTYIDRPSPLLDHFGQPITAQGTSHMYHTWSTDRAGAVQICTFRPEYWDSSSTLIQLIHKSFLWIIAYEAHRDSGKMIQDVLLDM